MSRHQKDLGGLHAFTVLSRFIYRPEPMPAISGERGETLDFEQYIRGRDIIYRVFFWDIGIYDPARFRILR
jgi:hypothetical protein